MNRRRQVSSEDFAIFFVCYEAEERYGLGFLELVIHPSANGWEAPEMNKLIENEMRYGTRNLNEYTYM